MTTGQTPELTLIIGGKDAAEPKARPARPMKSIRLRPDLHHRVKLTARILQTDMNGAVAWLLDQSELKTNIEKALAQFREEEK